MRKGLLKKVRRIVVKIGSGVLTSEDNGIDPLFLSRLAGELAQLRADGIETVVVSSGAVAAGRPALGLTDRPKTLPQKQAAAAVGQSRLMRAYEEAFSQQDLTVAQVLLTRDDLVNRRRFQNARSTLDTLLAYGIVPVINENDTVVVDELKFGDNDNLSALVTNLVEAQLLIILTDIDGLYTADPRTDATATIIPMVRGITKDLERAAGGSGTSVGTGGMATKLAAAKKVMRYGVAAIICAGKTPGTLTRAMAGEEVGTMFAPAERSLNRRKHWIAFTLRPAGSIRVDAGAREVLARHGRSLLPSGIEKVEGRFERGACVRVLAPDGAEFARGIVDYSSQEIERICRHKSSEIEEILGFRYGDDVIHRDNLVLL
ncbi:glutamate 5-kinase [Geomesophilobacter sediminis]|uniref:Glutamate 5-kinase n=1 Tax=Geomesophilobacter sediminis TaxID=2798584 RepID=A0A8J7INJ1_9BACT|nr:glutamate 5-kinase [Geomesophilobacter sediminis]MBJ6724803.1 glutamate 5-kinase [Geomesophilobacter sediminis]